MSRVRTFHALEAVEIGGRTNLKPESALEVIESNSTTFEQWAENGPHKQFARRQLDYAEQRKEEINELR